MLKIYDILFYVSVDGADWRRVGDICHTALNEEPQDITFLDNASFNEAREFLSHNHLFGVWNKDSLFIGKPTIAVAYADAWETVYYRRFHTISYKKEYREWENVTLEWIMKNLPADKCIQYLKERGITTCPMNF